MNTEWAGLAYGDFIFNTNSRLKRGNEIIFYVKAHRSSLNLLNKLYPYAVVTFAWSFVIKNAGDFEVGTYSANDKYYIWNGYDEKANIEFEFNNSKNRIIEHMKFQFFCLGLEIKEDGFRIENIKLKDILTDLGIS